MKYIIIALCFGFFGFTSTFAEEKSGMEATSGVISVEHAQKVILSKDYKDVLQEYFDKIIDYFNSIIREIQKAFNDLIKKFLPKK